jgi:hypothetical protein
MHPVILVAFGAILFAGLALAVLIADAREEDKARSEWKQRP